MCYVCVCTSVKYTNYISRPFSPSVSSSNPPHPPVRRLDRTSFTHATCLVSLVFSSSPGPPSRFLSLSLFLSCLFCLCPSPLFLLFSNKNNWLWNAFSCGITHRHQPPHAIRLSRGRGTFNGGGGVSHACHLVLRGQNWIYKEEGRGRKEIGVHELGRWQISIQFVESRIGCLFVELLLFFLSE